MNKKIAFIRTNNFINEPRLNKEYSAAISLFDCYVISWDREQADQSGKNFYSFNLRAKLGGKVYFLLFPVWLVFSFLALIKVSPDIVHACDSEGVISGILYAKLFRKKIIFDLWDATVCRVPQNAHLLKKFTFWLDRTLMERVDGVLLPDRERLEQIGAKENQSYTLIPNSDIINPREKVRLNFKDNTKIVVTYVGTLVRNSRGLEQIIQIAEGLSRFQFRIAGYGPDSEYIKDIINKKSAPNIRFLGKISYKESREVNRNSDLIISLLDPDFNNYKYATSTKVFDAFSSFKPIITTKNTASGTLVEQTGWGLAIGYDTDSLRQSLIEIAEGEKEFELDYDKIKKYDWREISKRLLDFYKNLVN